MARDGDFSYETKKDALRRQKKRCASCGTRLYGIGERGRAWHRFGEANHAHHVRHLKGSGTGSLANCVILCQSCHYSAHEGGNYRYGQVQGRRGDYPYYAG